MVRVIHFDALSSTNTVLTTIARAGGIPETAIVSDVQTAGRGQGTREWSSPRGGLWMSTLVTDPIVPDHAGWLPLAAGTAVADVLAQRGIETQLKWPNDLLVDDHKVGGVLVESSIKDDRLAWAVVGTGINVDNDPPLRDATSLKDHGYADGPEALAYPIARAIVERSHELAKVGPERIRVDWMQRQVVMGRRVSTPDAEGEAVELGEGGELVVDTGAGVTAVRSGPLRFVE